MERLIMLNPKADASEFSGQRQAVIAKLRKLGAARKPIPIDLLAEKFNRGELKVRKGVKLDNVITHHVYALAKDKLLRLHRQPNEYLVRLVRMPAEGELRGYALAVLETLRDNGRVMTSSELVRKLRTDTDNKNGQLAVWNFHKARLAKAGYIKLEHAVLPPKKSAHPERRMRKAA